LSDRRAGGTISGVTTIEIETPHGVARAYLHPAENPRAALVLGHGAGGGVNAPDLVAVTGVAVALGVSVALVEQPYRVAGRRTPPRAPQLDVAWIAVIERLRTSELRGLPLIVGGRSSGARVACRTADATGALGVLCLAFPLQPPSRLGATPAPSRLPELDAVRVPTLVVQGTRDPFGMPPGNEHREVVAINGDHGLKTDLPAVVASAERWLSREFASMPV
jgi:predicted alpha/beta-hydrolase family hydrolase